MKKINNKLMITISLLSIIVITVSLTLGKYIYNSVWNYYLTSRNFFFESDLLDMNTRNNSMLTWNGADVYFDLKNSSNDELVSEYNISYKVTCTVLGDEADYVKCVLNGTDLSTYQGTLSSVSYCLADSNEEKSLPKTECELNGYEWYNEPIKKYNYFNLQLTDNKKVIDEVSVKIVAESTSPYHKTLTGVFNLNRVEDLVSEYSFEYQSFSDYDELTIINKISVNKCFSIGFNSEDYSLDTEDNSITEKSYDSENKINNISVEIPKESSLHYDFYKLNNEKEYSIDNFTIEEKEC